MIKLQRNIEIRRKSLFFLLISLFLNSACFAAPNDKMQKLREKSRKEMIKKYTKEGWRLLETKGTLEEQFNSFWDDLESNQANQEVIGRCFNTKSKNTGLKMAVSDAQTTYVQLASQTVKGMVSTEIFHDEKTDSEAEAFYSAFQREIEKKMKGEMKKIFSIYKENPDGTFDIEVFYIVDSVAANKAYLDILEQSASENPE